MKGLNTSYITRLYISMPTGNQTLTSNHAAWFWEEVEDIIAEDKDRGRDKKGSKSSACKIRGSLPRPVCTYDTHATLWTWETNRWKWRETCDDNKTSFERPPPSLTFPHLNTCKNNSSTGLDASFESHTTDIKVFCVKSKRLKEAHCLSFHQYGGVCVCKMNCVKAVSPDNSYK